MSKIFTTVSLLSFGIYKSLTLIGICLGLFLFARGINGSGLGSIFVLLIGIFITIKEIMDMIQYASFFNFIGVGIGIVLAICGINGIGIDGMFSLIIGGFVIFKEVMDFLHSGN